MFRYLLFAGPNYYPAGGWSDYVDAFTSLDEAKNKAVSLKCDWYEIADLQTMEIVERS